MVTPTPSVLSLRRRRSRVKYLFELAVYYARVRNIVAMKVVVKNRAGAKVLPDGLTVKDVRVASLSSILFLSAV